MPGEGLTERLVQGTQKYGGGSVMVWGCMSWDGIGYSCKIDGRMDGDLYIQILEGELMLSTKHQGKTPSQGTFQQDSDPKHTCKKAKDQHTSRESLESAQSHPRASWSLGRGQSRSGKPFLPHFAGIWWRACLGGLLQ